MSRKSFVIPFIGFLAFFFVAVSLPLNAKEGTKSEKFTKEDKAVPVHVMEVRNQDLPIVVESVGRLYPDRSVTLSAQIPGEIITYSADVGDMVNKGQRLVMIKPVDYELALEEAQSNFVAAESRLYAAAKAYNRFKKLLPRKVISQDNFDKVESEYKTALAQKSQAEVGVKIAVERLKKTRITAPFSSQVAKRFVEVGQMIGTNDPVMTLLDLNRVRVKVFLTEKEFVHLDADDNVRITVEAYPDQTYDGMIDRIDINADPRTNTFGTEIIIDNKNLILKAGLSARVYITTKVIPHTILIPQSAVLFREKRTEVYVIDENDTASIRVVRLGKAHGTRIQVLEGLRAADRLVVRGQNYVKPGSKTIIKHIE